MTHLLSRGRVQLATAFLSRWEPIKAASAQFPPLGGRYASTIISTMSIALVRMLTPTLPILRQQKHYDEPNPAHYLGQIKV